ncbi:ergothioneine biosynthesis glutamate--cysteine ligase EgtA [Streptomyces sp. NPDC089799]|uniref:ergothioneine biosynthesis glutamate--cysteine ligase EgtA n=1 Tax=Streptomyces sp. NPDC089799 TaxID=3155066 RepID=UPI003425C592
MPQDSPAPHTELHPHPHPQPKPHPHPQPETNPQPHAAPPAPRHTISEPEAEDLVHGICFKTGPPRLLGAELEWLVLDAERPGSPVDPDLLGEALDAGRALPLRSRFTVEPGGQLELSSAPAASLTECVDGLQADLAAVRSLLGERGLFLHGSGRDARRPLRRLLRGAPRYDAMEAYLDRTGPGGRAMMCGSASVQVCVDAGYDEPGPLGYGRRWRMAHLLGAVLVAAFANSPAPEGRYAGWRCSRQGVWGDLDPRRTLAPPLDPEPRTAWTAHALDTDVMCVRPTGEHRDHDDDDHDGHRADTAPWTVPKGLTFREWLRGGGPRPPTAEDLHYHLTTLFPPVRPRGHLELRMIDAQPGDDGWVVPTAVVHALFDDPEAAETAYRAVKGLADEYGPHPAPCNPLWTAAARRGPAAAPELRNAAVTCFRAAAEALPRLGASREVLDAVGGFNERYVLRGRCPADDPQRPARRARAQTAQTAQTAETAETAQTAPAPLPGKDPHQ